jgi:hypothetical protein
VSPKMPAQSLASRNFFPAEFLRASAGNSAPRRLHPN